VDPRSNVRVASLDSIGQDYEYDSGWRSAIRRVGSRMFMNRY
jgi:hypothetical protein